MGTKQNVDKWKSTVTAFLDSKAEELRIMGYSQASREDVWRCLIEKVWRGKPDKSLHRIANDIMHLQSSIYLSYLTTKSYENDDLMASIAAIMETEKK